MKQASTDAKTEYILFDILSGARQKPKLKVEYFSDSDTWDELKDILSCDVTFSSRDTRKTSYALIPPAGQVNLNIINKNEEYTLGGGGEFDGVIRRNRKIRVFFGYILPTEFQLLFNEDFSQGTFYHTKNDSGDIKIDIFNVGDIEPEVGFVHYNQQNYDSFNYQIAGYFQSRAIDGGAEIKRWGDFSINCSENDKLHIQFRNSDLSIMDANWTEPVELHSGENIFDLSNFNKRYMQYRVLYDVNDWNDTVYFNSVSVYYYQHEIEWFLQGIFFLEDPSYGVRLNNRDIKIIGRDLFKKALDEKITSKSFASGTYINDILQYLADYVGWDNTSFEVNYIQITKTIYWEDKTVAEIMNELLFYIQKDGDYRLYIDSDGVLILKIKPSGIRADYVIHYFYHILGLNRILNSTKTIQEVIVSDGSLNKNSETFIGNYTGTSLGEVTINYSGYVNIRWIDNTGTVIRESFRGKNQIKFIVNNGDSYDIDIYGCKTTAGIYDISGNYSDLSKEKLGRRIEFPISLISNATEAKNIADIFSSYYQKPIENAPLSFPLNPLLELTDQYLIWDRYTLITNIYVNISMTHSFRLNSAETKLTMEDNSQDFGDIIWDKNGYWSGVEDIQYDKGFVWDMDLSPTLNEDPNDYENLRQVEFN